MNRLKVFWIWCLPILLLAQTESTYDPHYSFGPDFYSKNGNEYRSASGVPGPNYWQNRADYDIKTELFPEQDLVKGTVTIHYTNNSPDTLDFLWLQLDQNLFKPDSRGQNMISGNSRYGNRGEKIDGGYTISNVKVDGYHLIEDTRMQIQLSKPVPANGGKISFSMDFEFKIPVNGSDRMGHLSTKNGEIYTVAQWFPRMCVYDDVSGWNTMPYLGAGEFYCEYGDVNLDITAPKNQIVMASGELLNPKEVFTKSQYKNWEKAKKSNSVVAVIDENELKPYQVEKATQTWKYRMENTRDVAWASSNAFCVDAVKINLPSGKDCLAVSAQPIESNTQDSYGRGAEYVKGSVEFYSDYLYEYPYPMAINIASNQGGMEYPGIVFCGWTAKNASCWGVIDHEFGHIWFPMIVGTNERKFGWMDEGFNTFINMLSCANFNQGEYLDAGALPVAQMAQTFSNSEVEYIYLCPDAMKERNIGLQLYWKPGMGLKMLREIILGEERFDYAFRYYMEKWAYKHPQPDDFFRCIENAAGEDLGWFWRSWFLNNHSLDQAINEVEQGDGFVHVTVSNLKEMPMPIFMQLKLANGKTIEHHQEVDVWQRNSEFTISIPVNSEVNEVILDEEKILPDVNRKNNTWKK